MIMTSYAHQKVVCKCCNKEYNARILRSFSRFWYMNLDLNPLNSAVYDEVVACPHCGYATSRLYDEVDEKIRQAVNSENYKKIWGNSEYDRRVKKLIAAAYLEEVSGKWKAAAYQYLKATWYFQGLKRPEEAVVREKVIQCLKTYLNETPDLEYAMVLIDSLRQAGDFKEAKETAESLEAYLEPAENDLLCKILRYEKKLIEAEETLPHSMSEV